MYDLFDNVPQKEIKCLDHGFVRLIDMMPRLVPDKEVTADAAIVQAARVSYGAGTKSVNEDRGLIRYLMRHSHWTPVEMVCFKFHLRLPIFCARQMVRHRSASLNEISGRYSVLPADFYTPDVDNVRQQSQLNKQGGDIQIDENVAAKFIADLKHTDLEAYQLYEKYLEAGVSREQARMLLPIGLYTEWYWECDLRNLLHFLGLRCDKHAQHEMRVFANAMLDLIRPLVPMTVEAWEDYSPYRGAVLLSRLELEGLRQEIDYLMSRVNASFGWHGETINLRKLAVVSENKREQQEWVDKARLFGLPW